jgi:hypothetical protein
VPKFVPEKRKEYGALLDQALRGSVISLEDGDMSRAEMIERLNQII